MVPFFIHVVHPTSGKEKLVVVSYSLNERLGHAPLGSIITKMCYQFSTLKTYYGEQVFQIIGLKIDNHGFENRKLFSRMIIKHALNGWIWA